MENKNLENDLNLDPRDISKTNYKVQKVSAINLAKAAPKLNVILNSAIKAINLKTASGSVNGQNLKKENADITLTEQEIKDNTRKIENCNIRGSENPPGKKSNLKLLFSKSSYLLLILGALTVAFLFVWGIKMLVKNEEMPSNISKVYTDEEISQILSPALVPLDPFKLIIATGNITTELDFKLVLEIADGHDVEELYKSVTAIRSEVLNTLAFSNYENLKDERLRVSVGKEIKDKINALFTKEKVTAVYFFEFNITTKE